MEELKIKINELLRKADIAQKNGDFKLMKYYDEKADFLRETLLSKNGIKKQKRRIWIVPNNDLEAKTIIDLLVRNGEEYLVTGQAWGASWENLEDEIKERIKEERENGAQIYGVELQGNSNGTINIDHHTYGDDDRSNPKSSLEQVAEVIGVELSGYEMFVSANDKGYIPAMEELGRNLGMDEEELTQTINKVRMMDRKTQGVSEQQEEQAQEAVDRLGNIDKKSFLIIVKDLPHSKTSTITDRLYGKYDNLLVTSQDGETNFFGSSRIIEELNKAFPGGWSGGQLDKGSGFWGGYANQKDIIELVEKVSKRLEAERIAKRKISISMASDLHEAWRKTRLRPEGGYEPRIKKTKDQKWINEHGTDEVDIANCTFSQLPSDWQYENLAAATVAVDEVYDDITSGRKITKEKIEEMSSNVHEAWLERNSWVFDPEYGNPDQAKPYEELSEEEKAKDRVQIMQAKAKVEDYLRDDIQ